MSNGILKLFPKQLQSLPNLPKSNNLWYRGTLQTILIHDTYNHFKQINEASFSEEKYKTLDQVRTHFFKFAPKSDYSNNYTQEIEMIGYALKEFNVEELPAILFSKNFEILGLKNENIHLNENITTVMLIDIEKFKKENLSYIVNGELK